MCAEIFYTLGGLYAAYCVSFCCAMGYTLHRERNERRRAQFTELT